MSGAICRQLLALTLLTVVCAPSSAAAQTACDRSCLTGAADAWFTAMVAHDPSKAPIAPNARFTDVLTLVYPDGTRSTREMTTRRQFDMATAHIIKVRDRKIHEIETSGAVLPFGSKNGWTDFLR